MHELIPVIGLNFYVNINEAPDFKTYILRLHACLILRIKLCIIFLPLSSLPRLLCMVLLTATESLLTLTVLFQILPHDFRAHIHSILVSIWYAVFLCHYVHIFRVVEAGIHSRDLLQTGIQTDVEEVVTFSLTPAFREGQVTSPVSVAWSSLQMVRTFAALKHNILAFQELGFDAVNITQKTTNHPSCKGTKFALSLLLTLVTPTLSEVVNSLHSY